MMFDIGLFWVCRQSLSMLSYTNGILNPQPFPYGLTVSIPLGLVFVSFVVNSSM